MRFIPTRVHGVLDYPYAAAFFALPFVIEMTARTTGLLAVLVGVTLVYALVTRYERSLFRRLPMRARLAVDFLLGIGLIAYALRTPEDPQTVRWVLCVLGVGAVNVSLTARSASPLEAADVRHAPA